MSPSRRPRVAMAAPDPATPGGITRVVDAWLQAGLTERVELLALPTSSMDARLPRKLAGAARAELRLAPLVVSTGRRPDILHLHASTGASMVRKLVLARTARAAGIPYVAHLHSGGLDEWLAESARNRVLARDLVGNSAAAIVLAERWRPTALGLGARRVEVIPNGIGRDEREALEGVARRRSPDPGRLLFYGRLAPVKGLDLLGEALRRLGRADWELRVHGNGDRRFAAAAFAGLEERVAIGGWLEGESKLGALAQARAVVSPSRAEGMPLALIEARAAGAEVVATRVGGVGEVLGDYPGARLVEPEDPAALGAELGAMLDRAPSRIAGERLPERLRAERAVERVTELYEELLAR